MDLHNKNDEKKVEISRTDHFKKMVAMIQLDNEFATKYLSHMIELSTSRGEEINSLTDELHNEKEANYRTTKEKEVLESRNQVLEQRNENLKVELNSEKAWTEHSERAMKQRLQTQAQTLSQEKMKSANMEKTMKVLVEKLAAKELEAKQWKHAATAHLDKLGRTKNERNVLSEAVQLLGGDEAINEAVEKLQKEKEKQKAGTISDRLANTVGKYQKQKHHDKEAKERAQLLKKEYELVREGYTFDRTASVDERWNKVNAVYDVKKMHAKIDARVEKDQERKERVNALKKKYAPLVAAVGTINHEVVAPAAISIGMKKKQLEQEFDKKQGPVANFIRKTKQTMKAATVGLSSLNKEDGMGAVLARSTQNISKKMQSSLYMKFQAGFEKVTQPMLDKAAKWKNTYQKNLESVKGIDKEKEKEAKGPEL